MSWSRFLEHRRLVVRTLVLAGGLLMLDRAVLGAALPASTGAPEVGQMAPDFRLPDSNGAVVSLSELRAASRGGSWVLLVFYRGYW